jgi:DNA polymerase III alpha subunit
MNFDKFGRRYISSFDLADLLYQNPEMDVSQFLVIDPEQYNQSRKELHADLPELTKYLESDLDIVEFDQSNQSKWFMPEQYKNFDIAAWVLDQCQNQAELQRSGEELLLFQERNLFPLLCYLKYLVDTLREHRIVWGVGRGSSVASFVLYQIGIHRINSLYYDLDIKEFLKE